MTSLPSPDAVRTTLAEEIAAAIESAVCDPGAQCANRFCPDCIRWRQAMADAGIARRLGGAGESGSEEGER